MKYIPINLSLGEKKVLIVGGGAASLRKAKQLHELGISLRIVSPLFKGDFPQGDNIEMIYDIYHSDFLQEIQIVYSYTNSSEVNHQVLQDCKSKNILVSASDYKGESDFVSPAVWRHKDLSFAISSNEGNYRKSIAWRNRIQNILSCPTLEKPKVFLVGFGPGNPHLMTVRTHQILDQADEVFYDDLIDPQILDLYDCQKTYVGKRKGLHYQSQDQINELLFQSAQKGQLVVRLKGGDPFIFGRGGEELEFLWQRGIAVEVVPGITSALAAAASLRTPLTSRGVSKSVAFQTAHHLGNDEGELPKTDTLVLYMGATKLAHLQERLLSERWDENTPILLVRNASMPDEEHAFTRIKDLGKATLGSPLCIIIGNVAGEFQQYAL